MPRFYQKGWKAINASALRSTSSGGMPASVLFQDNSIRWYNRIMQNPGKRRQVLKRYDMMDFTIDISRALDIMAEDISSNNIETKDNFLLEFDADEEIKQTTIKTLEQTKKYWKERTGFDVNFFDDIREMLKYGSVFFLINEDFSLTKLVQARIEGYVLEQDDDTKVAAYIYNENATFKNEEGDDVMATASAQQNVRKIPISDLLILKVGRGPFGESVLEKVYRTWRHIQLIEDAIIVYRIVRAPERRIFYIDVGRQSGPRAEAYIEKVKLKMRQRQTSRNQNLDTDYQPQSLYEDYFVATSGESRSSKVETLPGGQNLDQIKDMIWFTKKLAIGLRIPMSYMQSAYDDASPQVSNDARVGTAYLEELRYAGFILRLQKKIVKPIFEHFRAYSKHIGVVVPTEGMEFKISEPQSFAIYRENDLYNTLFNTVTSANALPYLAKQTILDKFLHLTKEDIIENEQRVLTEKGYTEEQIDKLEPHHIALIVYGEGSVPFDPDTNEPIPPMVGAEGLFGDLKEPGLTNKDSKGEDAPSAKTKTAPKKKDDDK